MIVVPVGLLIIVLLVVVMVDGARRPVSVFVAALLLIWLVAAWTR